MTAFLNAEGRRESQRVAERRREAGRADRTRHSLCEFAGQHGRPHASSAFLREPPRPLRLKEPVIPPARTQSINFPKRSKRGMASQPFETSRDQYTKVALPLMSEMLANSQKRLS